MDYTKSRAVFKIRKVLRYIRLYGFPRTLIKIRGQYHMKREFRQLPAKKARPGKGGHIGLIGCGNFTYSHIAYFLKKNFGPVLRGAMDIDLNKAGSLFQRYHLDYYTDDPEEIFRDPKIDLVFIASNHATHAEYAIRALNAGKSVHIEKPHVVSKDQLERLCRAIENSRGKVRLGFNRPGSKIGRAIKSYLDTQDGPAMLNWFIAGHEIPPDHWYFKEEEGGRVLGNLCHWTDFVFQLIAPADRYPLIITPTRGEKSDCDIAVTFTFGDGSIAAITFSAKGHTFEGVRERFAAHRGDVLISMDDFKTLVVEVVEKKYKISSLFRDHGHEENILRSYAMAGGNNTSASEPGSPIEYIRATGELFLKTRQALEEKRKIIIPRRSGDDTKGER
jgi:predicted dehydrogenase